VSPVKYELGFSILEDIPHNHRRENLRPYIDLRLFNDEEIFPSDRQTNE
jgi:hypothetical protein